MWAEPLNAISSLAYFAVPVIVWFIAKDHVKQDRSFAGLLVLMFLSVSPVFLITPCPSTGSPLK